MDIETKFVKKNYDIKKIKVGDIVRIHHRDPYEGKIIAVEGLSVRVDWYIGSHSKNCHYYAGSFNERPNGYFTVVKPKTTIILSKR